MLLSIVAWIQRLVETGGYLGVLLVVILEGFIAPIPSQMVIPFVGFVASQGSFNIFIAILVVTVGIHLGTLPFYFIGLWGENFIQRFLRKYGRYIFLFEDDLEKGYEAFERYGSGIIFFGRFVPVIRSVISLPAGAARMNFGIFTLFTFLGSLIYASILCGAGYLLGENWEIVTVYIEKYENVVTVVLGILFVLYVIRGVTTIIKQSKESQKD